MTFSTIVKINLKSESSASHWAHFKTAVVQSLNRLSTSVQTNTVDCNKRFTKQNVHVCGRVYKVFIGSTKSYSPGFIF